MRTLALAALLAATPAAAGGLLLGVTTGGLLVPVGETAAPEPACPACATVPPTRPELVSMAPIRFPTRHELADTHAWLEPADLAAYEALRASREQDDRAVAGLTFGLAAP